MELEGHERSEIDPIASGPNEQQHVGQAQMIRLTAAKAVANTALRWVPFFLVTLEKAFDTTTAVLATILGLGEMAGLSTLLVGKRLDRGHEQTVMVASLVSIAVSGLVALGGSVEFFAISWVFLMLGASHITVSGHAWISARAPYERRARFLGVFETSWAIGLLVGAPSMALLIGWFGWRGPFVAVAITAAMGAVMIARMAHTPPIAERPDNPVQPARLNTRAWVLIGASAAIAMTGLSVIVIIGTWLNDDLGVSTGGIGLVAMAFGVAELGASSASAAFADVIGKGRSTRVALGLVLIGLAVMSMAETSLLVGGLGLCLFFVGFEYGIVTSFSLVSEAMPAARGRTLATNSAIGTVARGSGAIAAGLLYDRFGIDGTAALSAGAGMIAIILLTIAGRSDE